MFQHTVEAEEDTLRLLEEFSALPAPKEPVRTRRTNEEMFREIVQVVRQLDDRLGPRFLSAAANPSFYEGVLKGLSGPPPSPLHLATVAETLAAGQKALEEGKAVLEGHRRVYAPRVKRNKATYEQLKARVAQLEKKGGPWTFGFGG